VWGVHKINHIRKFAQIFSILGSSARNRACFDIRCRGITKINLKFVIGKPNVFSVLRITGIDFTGFCQSFFLNSVGVDMPKIAEIGRATSPAGTVYTFLSLETVAIVILSE